MKSLSFLLVTLVACGGTQDSVNQPATPGAGAPVSASRPSASGDVAFELPAAKIDGVLYEPDAIDRPGVPLVDPKKAITLDKQRALVQSSKDPVVKQAQAAVLATMLYRESKTDKAKEDEKLKEARQVLRDVAQQVGDKAIDELTLQLIGSYELIIALRSPPTERAALYANAEKAWQKLIEADPKSKDIAVSRTWLAFSQLKQFKNDEALKSLAGEKVDEKQAELAYIIAWAKFRTGDGAGAWQAITAAAKGWGQSAKKDELERDVLLFAARGRISLDQASPVLMTVLVPPTAAPPKVKLALQSNLLAKLGLTGYGAAGQWAEGVAALDKAVQVGGDSVPPADRVVIAYQQADFTIRLDTPDVAAKYGKQAIDAIGQCGGKCDAKANGDIALGTNLMGRLFHTLFATANDKRYYQPAHDLYEITIPLLTDPTTAAQAKKDAKTLETTAKNIKPGTGTHDKGALGTLLGRHKEEIQSCYEAALGSNPKLGGNISLTLESDASGAIKGVASEPAGGAAGLAAVAACASERAKAWALPKRGMAGNTRIKLSYTLGVKR